MCAKISSYKQRAKLLADILVMVNDHQSLPSAWYYKVVPDVRDFLWNRRQTVAATRRGKYIGRGDRIWQINSKLRYVFSIFRLRHPIEWI